MTPALRILLVEDSPTDAKLVMNELRRKLERPLEFERVEGAPEMRAALERQTWDVVLSDWSMPRFSGRAALDLAREMGRDVPFLIVSATVGEEAAVDAMRAGAHDYVLKDKLGRLAPAVERELRDVANRRARRDAETAARAADKSYRRMIETTSQGVIILDTMGAITFANERMLGMLDAPASEVLWRPATDFLDDAGRSLFAERRTDHREGRSGQSEVRLLRKGGESRWVLVESTPLFDDAGLYEGAFAMVTDVTARRKAEEELRKSEARFSFLASTGVLSIVVGDHEGKIVEANDAFLGMIGYSRAELETGTFGWRSLTPPEWRPVTEAGLRELREKGVVRPYEKSYVRKDGTRIPVLVGFAAIDEKLTIGFMIDLTAQKRAEEALRKTEEQLRQAQKMEAVGRLAGGVAHDFNNLLSVILSYSAMLADDLPRGDPAREDLQEIGEAGRRGAELTRQLLMFSRQEVVEPQVLDLNVVLSNMEKMLRRLLGEDIDFRILRAPELARVRADPGHIEQIVMNLVVNARDAMPTGGRLTIETKNAALGEEFAREHLGVTPGAFVMLAVSDTGIGMDKATQARIFEPFFTTKEKGKGTGLGLSTVFGIVQQCGGSIWVYSEPGSGTTFKIYVPLAKGEVDIAAKSLAPPTLRGTETILLVEDEDQLRVVASGVLRKYGYRVIEARNAGEALLECERCPGEIHLLLTDVVMPQMSGPALAKRLVVARPKTRVLCMSGYTDDAAIRHGAVDLGMAYLQKPITPEKLARKVRMVLDSHQE
ncbi:MAG TPA: response regulator [Polyangiaceae bacterium]|jgi:PAS domain S-box-containing protein